MPGGGKSRKQFAHRLVREVWIGRLYSRKHIILEALEGVIRSHKRTWSDFDDSKRLFVARVGSGLLSRSCRIFLRKIGTSKEINCEH